MKFTTTAAILSLIPISLIAGEANVIKAEIRPLGENRFSIITTVEHADSGWEHYANSWEVFDLADDKLLGKRVLLHPHVNEQPFTRSMILTIPDGVKNIVIKANDLVHGSGGHTKQLSVPR